LGKQGKGEGGEVNERTIMPLIDWAETNVLLEENEPIHFEKHQRKILGYAFKLDSEGRLPYSTVVYSCVKKSGKTTLLAIVALWVGCELAPKTEVILAANDLEQTTGRAYKEAVNIIERNPALRKRVASITNKEITLLDGTVIRAIPQDASGEAGVVRLSMSGWDELHGYVSERSYRLWDELTNVPTQKISFRLVVTYAGYTGESTLLENLYKRGMAGKRLWRALPVWVNGPLFFYWDTKPRMPWQTAAYYKAQRQELRPLAYKRLHENQWVSSESDFFEIEKWDKCVDKHHRPPLPDKSIKLRVAMDASTKGDRSAIVSTYDEDGRVKLGPKRFWQPSKKHPMDLEETMEKYILELHVGYTLLSVRYDPYQLHRSATTLRKKGVPMEEYPQTTGNLTAIGKNLYDLVEYRNIVLYESDDLRQEAQNAVAKETERGFRIVKDKASKKIDQIIALAMAALPPTKQRVIPRVKAIGDTPATQEYKEKPELGEGESYIEVYEGPNRVGFQKIGGPRPWLPLHGDGDEPSWFH
jgi:phage terminase large subunit-like protein